MAVDTKFSRHVKHMHRNVAEERFDMKDGQFFAEYLYKNLFWVLDGETIGFGDIRIVDVRKIIEGLKEGEVFEGFNEHHGSRWQQFPEAMIRIDGGVISFPHAHR